VMRLALVALLVALLATFAAPANSANAQPASAGLDGGTIDAGATALELIDAALQPAADDASSAEQEDAAIEPAALTEDEEPWLALPTALPPALPEPEILPLVTESQPPPASEPIAREDRPAVVIGTLLGLLALIALAFLGGHARVQEFERRLGISQVITAGFPFVLLGLFARSPAVNLLSDALLAELSPLLRVGLGCIGFVAGFRFSAQFRVQPSPPVVRLAAWATLVPFASVVGLCGALLLALSRGAGEPWRDPVFVRDAIILGTAGAMTARTSTEIFRALDVERVLARVLRLEELAGILGLAIVASYFRSADEVWHLPGTAWLLLTVGLGTTLGFIAYAILQRPREGPEFVVVTLGTIGFGAGIAGYLRLSPVVVCFIAATCVGLLPLEHKERLRTALRRLERPVYLLSLIVIGALWQVDDARGWLLIPVFTAARLIGKWLGTSAGARYSGIDLSRDERQVLAVSPMGPLAVAIVVNAQLLYPAASMSPIVAAVIGGAIATEVIVQLASRRTAAGDNLARQSVVFSEPPDGAT
jgi:hypothetical protein